MESSDQQQLRRLVLQRLHSLQNAGVLDLPRPQPGPSQGASNAARLDNPTQPKPTVPPIGSPLPQEEPVPQRRSTRPTRPETAPQGTKPDATSTSAADDSAPPMDRAQRVAALTALSAEVAACSRCRELASTRANTVFGVGDPMARLVFLGEAPGADEDRQGEPFVGRAGQLLTKIIEACTLRREDVYILNILKCRPPGNRNPLPDEVTHCTGYLQRQLSIIRPEFICCLGAVAAQNLLKTTTPIGKLRGKFHQFGEIKVVATYHPAYLLRNPNAKRATWDDMKMLMRELGIQIPDR